MTVTNAEIIEALRAAKQLLIDPAETRGTYRYICCALDHPDTRFVSEEVSARKKEIREAAKDVVQERLGYISAFGGKEPQTIGSYLFRTLKIEREVLTWHYIQTYRHAWLDALIVELQAKGD